MYRFRVQSTLIAVVCPTLGKLGEFVLDGIGRAEVSLLCCAAILLAKLENRSTAADEVLVVRQPKVIYISPATSIYCSVVRRRAFLWLMPRPIRLS